VGELERNYASAGLLFWEKREYGKFFEKRESGEEE